MQKEAETQQAITWQSWSKRINKKLRRLISVMEPSPTSVAKTTYGLFHDPSAQQPLSSDLVVVKADKAEGSLFFLKDFVEVQRLLRDKNYEGRGENLYARINRFIVESIKSDKKERLEKYYKNESNHDHFSLFNEKFTVSDLSSVLLVDRHESEEEEGGVFVSYIAEGPQAAEEGAACLPDQQSVTEYDGWVLM